MCCVLVKKACFNCSKRFLVVKQIHIEGSVYMCLLKQIAYALRIRKYYVFHYTFILEISYCNFYVFMFAYSDEKIEFDIQGPMKFRFL